MEMYQIASVVTGQSLCFRRKVVYVAYIQSVRDRNGVSSVKDLE